MAIVRDELEEERSDWKEGDTAYGSPYVWALPYVKDKVVADICCGLGMGTRLLAKEARFVRGYDYSRTAVRNCNKHPLDNVIYLLADVEETEIVGDVITCMQGLEHLHDPKKLIEKYKDRTWIFALPHEESLQIKHHKHFINDELIKDWFGDIDIYRFKDDGTKFLGEGDFNNFYGVYNAQVG